MKEKLNPIFLLNTPIKKLYDLKYLNTRVFLHIKALKLENLNQLLKLIKASQEEDEKKDILKIFGQKSVKEINQLFKQANIEIPNNW
jgi:hypothetical protein